MKPLTNYLTESAAPVIMLDLASNSEIKQFAKHIVKNVARSGYVLYVDDILMSFKQLYGTGITIYQNDVYAISNGTKDALAINFNDPDHGMVGAHYYDIEDDEWIKM